MNEAEVVRTLASVLKLMDLKCDLGGDIPHGALLDAMRETWPWAMQEAERLNRTTPTSARLADDISYPFGW